MAARIADLDRRVRQLSTYIDARQDLEPGELLKLLDLHSRLTARLGRLVRDRERAAGSGGDELRKAIDQALDLVSEEWGIEL